MKVNKEENGQRSRNILQRNLTYSGQKKERRSSFVKKNWKARKQLIYFNFVDINQYITIMKRGCSIITKVKTAGWQQTHKALYEMEIHFQRRKEEAYHNLKEKSNK